MMVILKLLEFVVKFVDFLPCGDDCPLGLGELEV